MSNGVYHPPPKCLACGEEIHDSAFCSYVCKQSYMEYLLEEDKVENDHNGEITYE